MRTSGLLGVLTNYGIGLTVTVMRQDHSFTKFFLLLVTTCVAFFAMSRANALFTSEKEVLRESRLQWLTMKRSMPRPADERIQPFVECISRSIIATLEEPFASMDWEVVVFDDDAANAFAMPGGKIGVFTGIFKVADTADALATVIGHEVAHLTENHVMERARKGALTDWMKLIGTSATGLGDMVSAGTDVLVGLPFDRRQESEADLVGLEYMAAAGFDPRSSLYLWKNMSQLGQGAPPEFLSTHPSDDRRMADLVSIITPALIAYNEALEAGLRPSCL